MPKYQKIALTILSISFFFIFFNKIKEELVIKPEPASRLNLIPTSSSIKETHSQILTVSKKNLATDTFKAQTEKICHLIKESPALFKGRIKIWSLVASEETTLMIKSQDCPPTLFSYVVLNHDGKIKELIDCHNTSAEELVLHAGIQGEIKESNRVKENRLDLAISGEGFFLERCRDQFYLIRRGDFFVAMDKTLVTSNGCSIVDRDGKNFKITIGKLDHQGCHSSQCLAIIQPQYGEFKFISRNRLKFLGAIEASQADSPYIFSNHLEEIERESGIIGPNFEFLPEFDVNICL